MPRVQPGIYTAYGLSQVLFGVSLSVPAGQAVCLLGRNGVGKDNHAPEHYGTHAAAPRSDRLRRRRYHRLAAVRGRAERHRAGCKFSVNLRHLTASTLK
jgi:ABC-type transporter Mla maintaining outer membrane lipid asymmetry ATPase subunit MlaF